MSNTYYHSSNLEKINVTSKGFFGEFMFFTSHKQHSHGNFLHSIELQDDDLIKSSRLFYHENWEELSDIVKDVMNLCDCTKDTAEELLSEETCLANLENYDSELDLHIQYLTAKCSKILGYKGVSVKDEHGTSYMIDMTQANFI